MHGRKSGFRNLRCRRRLFTFAKPDYKGQLRSIRGPKSALTNIVPATRFTSPVKSALAKQALDRARFQSTMRTILPAGWDFSTEVSAFVASTSG